MSKDKAPREFWIDGLDSYDKIIFDQTDVARFRKDFNSDGQYIHVIEFSAYAALEAKLAECVAALEWYAAENEDGHRGMWDFRGVAIAREVLSRAKDIIGGKDEK